MKKLAPLLILIVVGMLVMMVAFNRRNPAVVGDYKSTLYQIDGVSVQLVDGQAETLIPGSSLTTYTTYFGNEAKGDLNGDGLDDVAFLLTQDGGGTGTFFYVVAALKTATGYKGTNALLLGDRIAPQTTRIDAGVITVTFATRAADEPFSTRPSVGVSQQFVIKDGVLVLRSS